MFEGGFKAVSMFEEYFKEVLMMCEGRLRSVRLAFKHDSRELEGFLKEAQRLFQWSFKAVSQTF